MANLKINPQVWDDLESIWRYIAADDAKAASRVVDEILEKLENLKEFPEMGTPLKNRVSQKTKYRYLTNYSYASLYYVDGDTVIVSTIIHLSRDLEALKLDQ